MIYLDYAASAPMSEEALHVFHELNKEVYGNASSLHDAGGKAEHILNYCRRQLAGLIHGREEGIYFTSGGTESNILALQSVLNGLPASKRHFITTSVEHSSIRNLVSLLQSQGWEISIMQPDLNGRITPEILLSHLKENTGLVSIQHANSETGIIQDLQELSSVLKERHVLLHTDAVQTFGKIPVHADELGFDVLTVSSHKLYGPKGVGAVYIRPGIPWKPVYPGTTHEKGFRPGTVNVPGIGAFIAAAAAMIGQMTELSQHFQKLRSHLFTEAERLGIPLKPVVQEVRAQVLPHIAGCYFLKAEGQYIMLECNRNGICISTGSACAAGQQEPSPSVKALGATNQEALRFIRISFGQHTTLQEMDLLLKTLQTTSFSKL
ncbi:IscS subfamily cysteine desulfurase [Paenibacillus sp. P96]|uniref:IscS subfamily cysteine desulfurase n=1 Tax=Paenibacillus zeirhizosphaerae TaxID=2987519 RepID=A0ABT9FRU7_9BACL|nr:IscS subfamily cysteine desulfurase [Paenibacillus sp. P96]MDP4097241.1 IscS subfamily cysteine desulfurase [Paenibacillus sp. P96]